jgi:hypothetical protein
LYGALGSGKISITSDPIVAEGIRSGPLIIGSEGRSADTMRPLIILLELGCAEGQICPDRISLIWGAFVRMCEVGSEILADLSGCMK